MRKAAIPAAAIFSALVLALYFWRISPFLPERGGATCFAADYNPPRPIDLSSPRRDWKSIGEVSAMRLRLHFPPDEKPFRDERSGRGYDWRYSMRLETTLTDGTRLSSAASCEWSGTFIDRVAPVLSCTIDCDGGSVAVWRKFGENALSVRFEAGERLKTGGSCGEGGTVFIVAETEARSFAVEPQQQCADK
jgi:hypothetical protein